MQVGVARCRTRDPATRHAGLLCGQSKRRGERGILALVNSCHLYVGRLLELRAESGFRTVADVDAIFEVIRRELEKLSPLQRSVNVVDWRRCPVMSSQASERLLSMITRGNPRVERSATLVTRDSPTAVMQFVRLVRETNHPERRLFYDVDELQAWLDEVLTPEESRRLRAFLAYEEPADTSALLSPSVPPPARRR